MRASVASSWTTSGAGAASARLAVGNGLGNRCACSAIPSQLRIVAVAACDHSSSLQVSPSRCLRHPVKCGTYSNQEQAVMMWAGSKSFGTCATCMQVDTVRPVTPPQTKEGASMLQLQTHLRLTWCSTSPACSCCSCCCCCCNWCWARMRLLLNMSATLSA